jgi:hypothetical protein
MVCGRTLSLLVGGAMLVWGAGPTEAVAPRGLVERGLAPRLERPSATTSADVDELLELSPLRAQLEALADGVRAQLREAHGELDAHDRAMVDRVSARHFDSGILFARVRLALGRNADPGRLDAALAWFRSPLGRGITRHETEAFPAARAGVVSPSDERVALVQQLDERRGVSETALDVAMALMRSLARVAEPLRPAHLRHTRDQLESHLMLARIQGFVPIKIACLQDMLLAYAELTDAELAAYLGFLESPAGQWYTGAMNEALVDAASVAAGLAAAELVTLVPRLTESR